MASPRTPWDHMWTPIEETVLRGYVSCKQEVVPIIKAFEVRSSTAFVKDFESDNSKNEQKRVRFKDIRDSVIPADGVPFMTVSNTRYGCIFGPDRNAARKRNEEEKREKVLAGDHPANKTYKKLMVSKKKGCQAAIHVKEVTRFIDFQDCKSLWSQRRVSKEIRQAMEKGETLSTERRVYIRLPSHLDHQSTHSVGENELGVASEVAEHDAPHDEAEEPVTFEDLPRRDRITSKHQLAVKCREKLELLEDFTYLGDVEDLGILDDKLGLLYMTTQLRLKSKSGGIVETPVVAKPTKRKAQSAEISASLPAGKKRQVTRVGAADRKKESERLIIDYLSKGGDKTNQDISPTKGRPGKTVTNKKQEREGRKFSKTIVMVSGRSILHQSGNKCEIMELENFKKKPLRTSKKDFRVTVCGETLEIRDSDTLKKSAPVNHFHYISV